MILSEPAAPYRGYTYPQPLAVYIGRYEQAFLLERPHRDSPRLLSRSLWAFFSRFPKRKRPQDFWVSDAEDFKRLRLESGAKWSRVRLEMGYVRGFFKWLIEEQGLEMAQPVIPMPQRPAVELVQRYGSPAA